MRPNQNPTPTNLASDIWSLADLLRGDFKQSQYGRIILPFMLLRRLECVLEPKKDAVLTEYDKIKSQNLPETALDALLTKVSQASFYNISPMDLSRLGQSDIKDNLESYIQGFSADAREIFEHFKFSEFIGQLSDANLLYKIVGEVKQKNLSPQTVSNYEMGLVFEELIRRFAESSNETAGEHFTPRDIVKLATSLVFMEDDEALTQPGTIRTIYDPTAGTGGFLSSGMEYVHEMNPQAVMRAFGQELNPESYAICKADMMIKGQDVSNIKLGNTLSNDQLPGMTFDYMLSNPPFGVDWKKIEQSIRDEANLRGFEGRFGPGLPRVSDGSLLFLLHLISKLRDASEGGARIGIILNGSPLFTGGAGSGESEIRRYILEADLLEAIVALPTDMFYNTGIATYVWVLTNKKTPGRKGQVQLINAVNLSKKMRKSLGSKRKELGEDDITAITRCFGENAVVETNPEDEKPFGSKMFATHQFGYRRLTIERPLRESYQFSNQRLETLRFTPGALNEPMKFLYTEYGTDWTDDEDCPRYGRLTNQEEDIRIVLKNQFPNLKEKQLKELFQIDLWRAQRKLLSLARQIQGKLGTSQVDDMNGYEAAVKSTKVKLDGPQKKQLAAAVSWKNPDAVKVVKKIHKGTANPLYGLFAVDGQVLEYKSDSDLRDNENVPLNPALPVDEVNESYVRKEVLPHVSEAWIDGIRRDEKDGEVGIVGYEIPFNRHFYIYKPPRNLAEIDAELDEVSREIMALLKEVHS